MRTLDRTTPLDNDRWAITHHLNAHIDTATSIVALDTTPRWHLRDRRRLRTLLATHQAAELAAAAALRVRDDLDNTPVHRVANAALYDALNVVRRADSRRHPAHPEALNDLPGLAHRVSDAAFALTHLPRVRVPRHLLSGSRDVTTVDVPDLMALLTPARTADHIRARVTFWKGVADDDRFIHATDDEGRLTVQHVASGLRLRAMRRSDGTGAIGSKSYETPELAPAPFMWESVAGLGIGTRLYQHLATLWPDVRWPAGILSNHSLPVRGKLHALDPWRWEDPQCAWCRAHDWATLTSSATHPASVTAER